ncbi:uncharacterized protein LOC108162970 [Drosophila miranda]|uniref:uncharacterized protein LOC108162970 n=1 Tax=Drosophila miranda TaxID=7229 RepID=UPI0007E6B3E4|nr:uncharacterized protein LOC108162970 [Drosophila miranda]
MRHLGHSAHLRLLWALRLCLTNGPWRRQWGNFCNKISNSALRLWRASDGYSRHMVLRCENQTSKYVGILNDYRICNCTYFKDFHYSLMASTGWHLLNSTGV